MGQPTLSEILTIARLGAGLLQVPANIRRGQQESIVGRQVLQGFGLSPERARQLSPDPFLSLPNNTLGRIFSTVGTVGDIASTTLGNPPPAPRTPFSAIATGLSLQQRKDEATALEERFAESQRATEERFNKQMGLSERRFEAMESRARAAEARAAAADRRAEEGLALSRAANDRAIAEAARSRELFERTTGTLRPQDYLAEIVRRRAGQPGDPQFQGITDDELGRRAGINQSVDPLMALLGLAPSGATPGAAAGQAGAPTAATGQAAGQGGGIGDVSVDVNQLSPAGQGAAQRVIARFRAGEIDQNAARAQLLEIASGQGAATPPEAAGPSLGERVSGALPEGIGPLGREDIRKMAGQFRDVFTGRGGEAEPQAAPAASEFVGPEEPTGVRFDPAGATTTTTTTSLPGTSTTSTTRPPSLFPSGAPAGGGVGSFFDQGGRTTIAPASSEIEAIDPAVIASVAPTTAALGHVLDMLPTGLAVVGRDDLSRMLEGLFTLELDQSQAPSPVREGAIKRAQADIVSKLERLSGRYDAAAVALDQFQALIAESRPDFVGPPRPLSGVQGPLR